jgi:hypothetical protein
LISIRNSTLHRVHSYLYMFSRFMSIYTTSMHLLQASKDDNAYKREFFFKDRTLRSHSGYKTYHNEYTFTGRTVHEGKVINSLTEHAARECRNKVLAHEIQRRSACLRAIGFSTAPLKAFTKSVTTGRGPKTVGPLSYSQLTENGGRGISFTFNKDHTPSQPQMALFFAIEAFLHFVTDVQVIDRYLRRCTGQWTHGILRKLVKLVVHLKYTTSTLLVEYIVKMERKDCVNEEIPPASDLEKKKLNDHKLVVTRHANCLNLVLLKVSTIHIFEALMESATKGPENLEVIHSTLKHVSPHEQPEAIRDFTKYIMRPIYKAWKNKDTYKAFPIDLASVQESKESAYRSGFGSYLSVMKNYLQGRKEGLSPDPAKHEPGTSMCQGWDTVQTRYISTGTRLRVKATAKNEGFMFPTIRKEKKPKKENAPKSRAGSIAVPEERIFADIQVHGDDYGGGVALTQATADSHVGSGVCNQSGAGVVIAPLQANTFTPHEEARRSQLNQHEDDFMQGGSHNKEKHA